MHMKRQRRLNRCGQRAWRRREAPAGDDGQNHRNHRTFDQDRSNQWPRVQGSKRKHWRKTEAIECREAQKRHHERQLDRQDQPISGLDQGTKTLKLDDGNGLDVVETLHTIRPESRVVVLTGFGNIATAVAAVKYGAIDYLPKPADADDILAALMATPGTKPKPPENPMSADRVRWEHIQRVYELCGHNVSETARRLNMHRRTLQRILAKRSPR